MQNVLIADDGELLLFSCCTRLLVAGADIETIRDLAGHRDISTTGRYLSTTSERRRAAVEATV